MKQEITASIIAGIINALLSFTLLKVSFAIMTLVKAFAFGFVITIASIYLAKLFKK